MKKDTAESNARLYERQASLLRQLAEIADALAHNALEGGVTAQDGGGTGNGPPPK
ncbi:MAG: hypothetical protein ACRCYS_08730 [Beijerinckiaceae bacterium]